MWFKNFTEEQERIIEKDRIDLIETLKDIIEELEKSDSDTKLLQTMNKVTFYGDQIRNNLKLLNIEVI